MTTISAVSVLSSRHALVHSKRVDTLLLRYPRWIHAELMTHRVFSRNAASSRAIPIHKLIQYALDDPAAPIHWGANQKGMQAYEQLSGAQLVIAKAAWHAARYAAVACAKVMAKTGAHKQLANRLLEPFTHITVVVTSTNWSNFLALRDHPDAEPHIRMLAQAIRVALNDAEIQELAPGEWHLPFVTVPEFIENSDEDCLRLSAARCASTSYKTVDGFDMTIETATRIHDDLVGSQPLHASPCEHQAKADAIEGMDWVNPRLGGNLGPGWVQYRKTLSGECQ